jgi:hypothetical protein
MLDSLATDPDYSAVTESPAPWWRRQAEPISVQAGISVKERWRYLIVLRGGSLEVDFRDDTGVEPSWLQPALSSLSDIGSLQDNWDSYGARSVTLRAVAGALRFLGLIMADTMPMPTFVPTRSGGVQVEWHARGIDLEVRIEPNGQRWYAAVEGATNQPEWSGDITSNLAPLSAALATLAAR